MQIIDKTLILTLHAELTQSCSRVILPSTPFIIG